MARKSKPGAPKAPYESTHKRVPIPVSEPVQEIIDWYRDRLRQGYKAKELPNLSDVFLFVERLEKAVEEIEKLCSEINEYEHLATGANFTPEFSHDRFFIAKSPLYKKMKDVLYKTKTILELNENTQEIEKSGNSKLPELPPYPPKLPPYPEERVFKQERNIRINNQ